MAYNVSRGTVYAAGAPVPRELRDRFADTLNVKDFGARGDGVTDDTAAVNAAIAALCTRNGGTVLFPVGTYYCTGQITVPYTGTPPLQKPVQLVGVGAHFTGGTVALGPNGPNGGSILDLRYNGSYGKILTLGHGLLGLAGLTLRDTAGTTLPFIYTTNTTLHVHHCAIFGSKVGQLCDQDAIILGGTVAAYGDDDPTHGFQGYGTVIESNYFDGIRRAVFGRVYANGVVVRANVLWANCGAPAGGAAIEFYGDATDQCTGNNISDNILELAHYPYGIALTNAFGNLISGNGMFDNTATTLAAVKFAGAGGANIVVPGMKMSALPLVTGNLAGQNNQIIGPWERLDVGGAIAGASGEALRLYAGVTSDHVYMQFNPRSALPSQLGGLIGFAGGPATTEMYVQNSIGPVYLNAPAASFIATLKPHLLAEAIYTPATGSFTVDANTAQNIQIDLATAAGAWSLSLTNGFSSALLTVTVRNTSAGAVTLTWPVNVHLAGAWVDPGTGNNRSVILRRVVNAWYEISRTAADVAN